MDWYVQGSSCDTHICTRNTFLSLDVDTSFPGAKVSLFPLSFPIMYTIQHFEEAARILIKQGVIKYVASINTIGNAFAIDAYAEMPVIASKGGFAGLSGPAVKYTALANVKKMRELLDPSIDVVGVGGVQTGIDVFEMILCGASAVQVGTCHWIEGPKCFDRICAELEAIMEEKGYTSIDDFKGKLKPWSKEGAAASREARKDREGSSTTRGRSTSTALKEEGGVFMYLSAILLAVLTILLADKVQFIKI